MTYSNKITDVKLCITLFRIFCQLNSSANGRVSRNCKHEAMFTNICGFVDMFLYNIWLVIIRSSVNTVIYVKQF